MKTFCFGAGGPPLFNATNQNIWWEMLQSFSANSGLWIATRGNSCNTDVAGFGMFKAFSNGIMMDYLFNSDDSPLSDCTHFVQPVVTLKLDIRGEKAQDGSWNLDV